MYSDLECGVCYRTYNAGRRCPLELRCRHSFCKSCVRALSRPTPGPDGGRAEGLIVCPLCRHTTSTPGEEGAGLRVDEGALERLAAAGALDREEDPEDEEEEEEEEDDAPGGEGPALPDAAAGERGSSAGSGGGRLRRSWRKVWRKISGKRSRGTCMTNDDLRNLAMMSCYMF